MNLELPPMSSPTLPWTTKHVDPTLQPGDSDFEKRVRKDEKPKKPRKKDKGPKMIAKPRPKKPYEGPQE